LIAAIAIQNGVLVWHRDCDAIAKFTALRPTPYGLIAGGFKEAKSRMGSWGEDTISRAVSKKVGMEFL
jgi:hypothetical protein